MIKEIDKPEEPPKIAVKFANTVFLFGILYSILLIFYATYKIYNPPEPVSQAFYIICIIYGGVIATLFGFGLKVPTVSTINSLCKHYTKLTKIQNDNVLTFKTYQRFTV